MGVYKSSYLKQYLYSFWVMRPVLKFVSKYFSFPSDGRNFHILLLSFASLIFRGEYGAWSAFLALLVRLFFYIPGKKISTLTCID